MSYCERTSTLLTLVASIIILEWQYLSFYNSCSCFEDLVHLYEDSLWVLWSAVFLKTVVMLFCFFIISPFLFYSRQTNSVSLTIQCKSCFSTLPPSWSFSPECAEHRTVSSLKLLKIETHFNKSRIKKKKKKKKGNIVWITTFKSKIINHKRTNAFYSYFSNYKE